jgi:hypothetical protein
MAATATVRLKRASSEQRLVTITLLCFSRRSFLRQIESRVDRSRALQIRSALQLPSDADEAY